MSQHERIFFYGEPPSPERRLKFLNPDRVGSPYYGYIGNRNAIERLIRIDFQALGRYNHNCSDLSVAFIGQPGCGKTELAKRHTQANGLPTLEVSPKSIKCVQDLFNLINKTCLDNDLPLTPNDDGSYVIPPMNLFIDEVHALAPPVVQGLLKATEPKDSVLVTEKQIVVDCSRIHWIIATTDRGKLFDAFDTRFSKVVVNLYNKDEIAKIVQVNFPDMPVEACRFAAHYCSRIPRETISFAKEMKMEKDMHPEYSWEKISSKIAADNEIDSFGMTYKRLAILKALGQGPVADKRMPIVAGCKKEELNKFILPWLLENTEDQRSLITVSSKGYTITEAGLEELNKRQINNKGFKAIAA